MLIWTFKHFRSYWVLLIEQYWAGLTNLVLANTNSQVVEFPWTSNGAIERPLDGVLLESVENPEQHPEEAADTEAEVINW